MGKRLRNVSSLRRSNPKVAIRKRGKEETAWISLL